jgi:magnesium-transporting ATPase (P-type)
LNKVANDISKVGLICALFAVIVLYLRFIIEISIGVESWKNSSPGLLVNYFVVGITVLVVAVPEGLPLAVTISLAYSVLQM